MYNFFFYSFNAVHCYAKNDILHFIDGIDVYKYVYVYGLVITEVKQG